MLLLLLGADDEVEIYLNLPAVQKALHANQTVLVPGPWRDCNHRVSGMARQLPLKVSPRMPTFLPRSPSQISYSRDDLLSSMLPTWRSLIAAGAVGVLVGGQCSQVTQHTFASCAVHSPRTEFSNRLCL